MRHSTLVAGDVDAGGRYQRSVVGRFVSTAGLTLQ